MQFLRVMRSVALLCFFLAFPSWGQVVTADITGVVMDPTGATIPGVRITVVNVGTNLTKVVTSTGDGSFSVTLLPPGTYNIKAEAVGFKSWEVHDLKLAIGDKFRVDPSLSVGLLNETVEVSAGSPSIQREESSVGTLVGERAVQDLPLNGRNFVRLAQIAPGATEGAANSTQSGTRPDDRRQSSSVSINGQTSDLNNFLIDGTDDNERFLGNVVVKPSIDGIQEMKIETNSYSAVLGRTAGGVISIVTKPGTNALHGTVYEYFRNEVLDARNYFARTGPKPAFKQNQFGGSLGGPVLRDRLFYFGDYERFTQRVGQTYNVTVPTLAQAGGADHTGPACFTQNIFDPATTVQVSPGVYTRQQFAGNCIPNSRWNSAARNFIARWPSPNGGSTNNYSSSPAKRQDSDSLDARADYKISDKDFFFARYSYNDTRTVTPAALPVINGVSLVGNAGVFPGPSKQRSQGIQLNYTRLLTSNLVLEAKMAYTRFANAATSTNTGTNAAATLGIPGQGTDPTTSGVPTISIAGGPAAGDATFVPIITKDNSYQEIVGITYTQGRQTIRFGTSYIQRQVASSQSSEGRGQYAFGANLTGRVTGNAFSEGNALASFILGLPGSESRNILLAKPQYSSHEGAFYFQDDWKVTRNLTVNLGGRLDWWTPMTEKHGNISNFNPGAIPAPGTPAITPMPGTPMPSIIQASVNDVNASAGVKTYRWNLAPRLGFAYSIDGKTVIRGGFGLSYYPPYMGSALALRNPPFVSLYGPSYSDFFGGALLSDGMPAPLATSAAAPTGNLTVVDFNLKMPYVEQFNLTLQRELPTGFVATVTGVGALTRRSILAMDINPAPPQVGSTLPVNQRRIYDVAYPTTLGFSNGNPLGGIGSVSQSRNWNKADYFALQTVLERRFSNGMSLTAQNTWSHSIDLAAPLYFFNDPRSQRGNSDLDVRERFSVSFNYQIPFFKNANGVMSVVGKGWQVNGITLWSKGFPFTVTNATARNGGSAADRPNLIANPNQGDGTINKWFNTAAFVSQPAGTFGNSPRNLLTAPSYFTQDVSLFKSFNVIGDKLRAQFRAEAFNVLNAPNFVAPGAAFGGANFGVITSTGNFLPRNLQFAVKFDF